MSNKRLAIVTTHPIQYYAPIYRALAASERIQTRVFFTWSQASEGPLFDPGFGTSYQWDVPLLDGYESEFVLNVARDPVPTHFHGVVNPDLNSRIAGWGADAVLVFAWNLHSHLGALRHFKNRIPVFFRGDSTLLSNRSRMHAFGRRLFLNWVYRHVDYAFCVGQNSREYFQWCGIPTERIRFAPHSIDNERFADAAGRDTARAAQIRGELGIDADDIVYVYAGKLIDTKDPVLMLDAFQSISQRAHLVFFGNGDLEGELRRRAAGHANIHFRPFQNQSAMPAVYRLADVFILPSKGETWGLAVNEAMASARPVIVSNRVGAARDLVLPGINGWIFQSGSVDSLAAALHESLAAGRNGLRAMGDASQQIIRSWSPQTTAKGIADAVLAA